jgi:hypothetical protein
MGRCGRLNGTTCPCGLLTRQEQGPFSIFVQSAGNDEAATDRPHGAY